MKAVLDSELLRASDQWDERRGAVQPQRAPTLLDYPSGKNLWGILLSTGGSLKATRGSFCAAAAEGSVTFALFADTTAAWVVCAVERLRIKLGRIEAAWFQQVFFLCSTCVCAGAGREEPWGRKDARDDFRTHGLDLRAFLGGWGAILWPVKEWSPTLRMYRIAGTHQPNGTTCQI